LILIKVLAIVETETRYSPRGVAKQGIPTFTFSRKGTVMRAKPKHPLLGK
jgi:hypothetical protein